MLTYCLYDRISTWCCRQDTAWLAGRARSLKQAYLPPPLRFMQTFSSEEITRDSFHMLDHMMLKELGIKTMGDVLTILKSTKEHSVPLASYIRPPTVKFSQLSSEMTSQQFWKFRIDWDIFTKITSLPTAQTNIQLYYCANEAV